MKHVSGIFPPSGVRFFTGVAPPPPLPRSPQGSGLGFAPIANVAAPPVPVSRSPQGSGVLTVAPMANIPPPPASRSSLLGMFTTSATASLGLAPVAYVPPPPGLNQQSTTPLFAVESSVVIEPPPGLAQKQAPLPMLVPLQDQQIQINVGHDDDKWDAQSMSSFTSTATSKSQSNRCKCDKCRQERRNSRHQSTKGHKRSNHRHRPKSFGRKTLEVVMFPMVSCIAT